MGTCAENTGPFGSPKAAYKPKRTYLSPVKQGEILAKRAIGGKKASIRNIAKEVGVTPTTVRSVINLTHFDSLLEENKRRAVGLNDSALDVVKKRLEAGSESMAIAHLRGTGVYGGPEVYRASSNPMQVNTALHQQIINLVQPRPDSDHLNPYFFERSPEI